MINDSRPIGQPGQPCFLTISLGGLNHRAHPASVDDLGRGLVEPSNVIPAIHQREALDPLIIFASAQVYGLGAVGVSVTHYHRQNIVIAIIRLANPDELYRLTDQ